MRFLIILFVLIFTIISFPLQGQAAPNVSANNAVLIEQSTGRIFFEKQAHERQSIASITKIMTAIIAIESGKMEEYATASREAVYTEGSSIYLEQGEKMKIEDLVYGLMLRSGNDAAVAIAEHIGGSLEGFVYLMNEKATWLGMTNTHFDNPHGLDSDTHYSSAYDMALLMRYAMDNEIFREISATTSYLSENRSYYWQNKNKLLTKYYEHCTGGKTGFTKKTGRTLVSSANKDGMDLIAVTLNAPDDWRDHINMFEYGFDNYNMESISNRGKRYFELIGLDETTDGYYHDTVYFPLTKDEKEKLSKKNYMLQNENKIKNDIIGKTIFYVEDKPLTEVPIYTTKEEVSDNQFGKDLITIMKKVIGMSNG